MLAHDDDRQPKKLDKGMLVFRRLRQGKMVD
jgi:hypothetical protein